MECLSPAQLFLNDIILSIEGGMSCNMAFKKAIQVAHEPIKSEASEVLFHCESGKAFSIRKSIPDLRKAIYETVVQGTKGIPVLERLELLAQEAALSAEKDLDDFISKTPTLSLFIVLFLFFPAFLLLIMGPILQQMLNAFGG